MYVCVCKGLRERDFRAVLDQCGSCPLAVKTALGLEDETCCGRCAENLAEIISRLVHSPQATRA